MSIPCAPLSPQADLLVQSRPCSVLQGICSFPRNRRWAWDRWRVSEGQLSYLTSTANSGSPLQLGQCWTPAPTHLAVVVSLPLDCRSLETELPVSYHRCVISSSHSDQHRANVKCVFFRITAGSFIFRMKFKDTAKSGLTLSTSLISYFPGDYLKTIVKPSQLPTQVGVLVPCAPAEGTQVSFYITLQCHVCATSPSVATVGHHHLWVRSAALLEGEWTLGGGRGSEGRAQWPRVGQVPLEVLSAPCFKRKGEPVDGEPTRLRARCFAQSRFAWPHFASSRSHFPQHHVLTIPCAAQPVSLPAARPPSPTPACPTAALL